jgi:hypothetical protein
MSSARFISLKVHGLLDYAVAATLLIAPFVLGFSATSPLAHWLSVAAGLGLVAYSLLTDYSMGARALIPFRLHLVFDFIAGATFVVTPFIAGFGGSPRAFYLAIGAAVMAVVLTSKIDASAPDKVLT